MNKFFLISVLFTATQTSYAQTAIPAGAVQLGGSINYTHNSEQTQSSSGSTTYTGDYSNNTLILNPYVGFFAANNLAIGLSLGYAASKQHYSYTPNFPNSTSDSKTTSRLRVGPYAQYYRMLTDQFGLTGTFSAGYEHDFRPGTHNSNSNTATSDVKSDGFYVAITPGIVFFPIPRFSLGASIGSLEYYRLSVKPDRPNLNSDYKDIVSSFGASFGLNQLTFSGAYYFGR